MLRDESVLVLGTDVFRDQGNSSVSRLVVAPADMPRSLQVHHRCDTNTRSPCDSTTQAYSYDPHRPLLVIICQ